MADETWDGQYFSFPMSHFTDVDVNPGESGGWVASGGAGPDPANGDQGCGMGSSVGYANGTLRQKFSFPTYKRMGLTYGASLAYDSFSTAGSSASSAASTTYGAVTESPLVASPRGLTVQLFPVPHAAADGALGSSPGSCTPGSTSALPLNLTVTESTLGSTVTQTLTLPAGAADLQLIPTAPIPLTDASDLAAPHFERRHVVVQSTATGACVGGGAGFGQAVSRQTPVVTTQTTGPLLTLDQHVFVNPQARISVRRGLEPGEH